MFKALALASLLFSPLAFAQEITGLNVEFQSATTPENRGYAISETASEFLFLPSRGDNSAQFAYSRENTPITFNTDEFGRGVASRATVSTNDYAFTFIRNISSATYLTFDLGYQTSGVSLDGSDVNSAGLRDFGLSLTCINHKDNWNLIYGSKLTVSPARAEIATAAEDGNRFSGGLGLMPFIAFEAISHTAVWGGKLDTEFHEGQTQNLSGRSNGSILASAFYEVPIFPTARIGFSGSGGHDQAGRAGSYFNMFGAGAYSKIQLPKQADVILKIQAVQQATTSTDATIALRKTL